MELGLKLKMNESGSQHLNEPSRHQSNSGGAGMVEGEENLKSAKRQAAVKYIHQKVTLRCLESRDQLSS
jgi:hypothetical protein